MAKQERTIWEMMGAEPPAAYREAPPPRGGRGAVQSVRFTVRRAAAVRTDGFIGPTDPLRIGDGDDSLVRRFSGFFSKLVGLEREAGESPEA